MFLKTISILLLNKLVVSALKKSQEFFRSDHTDESLIWGDFDSTSPHIFSSLRYLLQQWPNTMYPNGHSIVPCEVPAFSRFYHGRTDDLLPASPEWLAFDIEMAYGIMGSTQSSHMLTYQINRPVKCVYFDGMSAALLNMGQLQSQSIFLYGNETGPLGLDEYRRAQDLCKWTTENGLGGLGWGVEGIVRMLVDHISVAAPQLRYNGKWNINRFKDVDLHGQRNTQVHLASTATVPRQEHANEPAFPLPLWSDLQQAREQEPFFDSQAWEWFRSTTRQYGQLGEGDGETRVKLMTCGFVTFYDPDFDFRAELPRSTIFKGTGVNPVSSDLWDSVGWSENHSETLRAISFRRRWHNIEKMGEHDGKVIMEKTKKVLQAFVSNGNTAIRPRCTGIDWHAIANEIADRFSKPLLKLIEVASACGFGGCSNDAVLRKSLRSTRSLVHAMLLPEFEYPQAAFSTPSSDPGHNETCWTDEQLDSSTHARCRSHYTRFAMNEGQRDEDLTVEERLIVTSTEDVMSSICGTLISVLLFTERNWLTHFNAPTAATKGISNETITQIIRELRALAHRLKVLWAWLGWEPDRMDCERKCEWDEECYIPMWPLRLLDGRIVHDPTMADQPEEELLSPRCIKMEMDVGAENVES
ncbi:MAG: hypothetical protein Q9160_002529 [Pyrenula sp. 1 TL-2023]